MCTGIKAACQRYLAFAGCTMTIAINAACERYLAFAGRTKSNGIKAVCQCYLAFAGRTKSNCNQCSVPTLHNISRAWNVHRDQRSVPTLALYPSLARSSARLACERLSSVY